MTEAASKLVDTKIQEIMNRKPPTVHPDTSILELLDKLLKQGDDYFLVIEKGRLIGIITEKDVLEGLKKPSKHAFVGISLTKEMSKIKAEKAREIMTSHPVTVDPDSTIQKAIDLMSTHGFRHLPVVKEQRLLGALTVKDIGKHFLRLLKEEK